MSFQPSGTFSVVTETTKTFCSNALDIVPIMFRTQLDVDTHGLGLLAWCCYLKGIFWFSSDLGDIRRKDKINERLENGLKVFNSLH
jgi:hypothetical protein